MHLEMSKFVRNILWSWVISLQYGFFVNGWLSNAIQILSVLGDI